MRRLIGIAGLGLVLAGCSGNPGAPRVAVDAKPAAHEDRDDDDGPRSPRRPGPRARPTVKPGAIPSADRPPAAIP